MQIKDIQDCPEFVEILAAWDFGHWGFRREYSSYDSVIKYYKQACEKKLPNVYVAIDEFSDLPMGMVSLMIEDIHAPKQLEYSPYLVSLYVQERFRNKGVGQALIKYVELASSQLGYDKLYLNTRNARNMFQKFSWEELEKIFNKPQEKPLFLMSKVLS